MVDIRADFGEAMRRRREKLGITQEVLAHRAGLHRTYIGDVERGARNPSLISISRIARALDLEVCTCELLEFRERRPKR